MDSLTILVLVGAFGVIGFSKIRKRRELARKAPPPPPAYYDTAGRAGRGVRYDLSPRPDRANPAGADLLQDMAVTHQSYTGSTTSHQSSCQSSSGGGWDSGGSSCGDSGGGGD